MWKYEQEFRIDKPETAGETDKHFDLDNYKDWLEEQLTDCRKQLSIQRVNQQRELLDWLSNEPDHNIRKSDIEEILQDFKYYQSNCG